jgi:hypothetical protein
MQWEDIDGRQPLLDDPASWRSLFDHYDVQLIRTDLLVLKQREVPRYSAPVYLLSASSSWNTDIPVPTVPPGNFVLMTADVTKNFYGLLRGLVFRNSPTFLQATYASGLRSQWRVTRANLVDGAFVSYLPHTLYEALRYFGTVNGTPSADPVVSIRFETPGLLEFSKSIQLTWHSVAARPGEPTLDVPRVEPVPATGALAHQLGAQTRAVIDSIDGKQFSNPVQAPPNTPITLSGWAVDLPANKMASAVYLDVDGHTFSTSYGLPRADVASALGSPQFGKSGFTGQIEAGSGTHQVLVRVVNAARTGYYVGPAFTLNIK